MSDDNSIIAAGGWCAPSATVYSMAKDGPRMDDLLRMAMNPTPEELEARKAWEARRLAGAQWLSARLQQIDDPVTVLALSHHGLSDFGYCSAEDREWPCSLALDIAVHYRIIRRPDDVYDWLDVVEEAMA